MTNSRHVISFMRPAVQHSPRLKKCCGEKKMLKVFRLRGVRERRRRFDRQPTFKTLRLLRFAPKIIKSTHKHDAHAFIFTLHSTPNKEHKAAQKSQKNSTIVTPESDPVISAHLLMANLSYQNVNKTWQQCTSCLHPPEIMNYGNYCSTAAGLPQFWGRCCCTVYKGLNTPNRLKYKVTHTSHY